MVQISTASNANKPSKASIILCIYVWILVFILAVRVYHQLRHAQSIPSSVSATFNEQANPASVKESWSVVNANIGGGGNDNGNGGAGGINKNKPKHNEKSPTTTEKNSKPLEPPMINNLPITSVNHIQEFRENLDPNYKPSSSELCLPWDVNGDEWWTHHPEWEPGAENDTHYCLQQIKNQEKATIYRQFYDIQFHGNCSNTFTKRMWNSGWSADFTNVVDGLEHALLRKRPVQIVELKPWHFAWPARKPTKDNKNVPPACPRKNMFCYFLPLSKCPAEEVGNRAGYLEDKFSGTEKYQTYYEYATRRQTWLRKRIYDYAKAQNIMPPCTAIHVRRGDVVLHGGDLKRRYHAISEYIHATNNLDKNVYIMTDDQNALNEAKIEFPNIHWMYIDRPRYRAAEGGWEKQIPSNDPTFEVTALLTEFQVARKCTRLIHSRSGFATQLYWEMKSTGNDIERIDLDTLSDERVHDAGHGDTLNISLAYSDAAAAAAAAKHRRLSS